MSAPTIKERRKAPLNTPSGLSDEATRDITAELNALLADVFGLYMKTKNYHWHMSGPYFRSYHLLLDDHGDQIFAKDRRHHAALDRAHRPSAAALG